MLEYWNDGKMDSGKMGDWVKGPLKAKRYN
jgi:hypothetical protein